MKTRTVARELKTETTAVGPVATESETIATECKIVATGSETIATGSETIATECKTVATASKTIATASKIVAIGSKTIAMEMKFETPISLLKSQKGVKKWILRGVYAMLLHFFRALSSPDHRAGSEGFPDGGFCPAVPLPLRWRGFDAGGFRRSIAFFPICFSQVVSTI